MIELLFFIMFLPFLIPIGMGIAALSVVGAFAMGAYWIGWFLWVLAVEFWDETKRKSDPNNNPQDLDSWGRKPFDPTY